MGDNMSDYLINPLQCEDNNVRVDLQPKHSYPNERDTCQSIMFGDRKNIPLEFDGVLPYIRIHRPTPEEIETCSRLQLTSDSEWDPNQLNGIISNIHQDCNYDIVHTGDS